MIYRRPQEQTLKQRLNEPVRYIQILAGPRQVGKTTMIRDIINQHPRVGYYVSVDDEPDQSFSGNSWTIPSAGIAPPTRKDAEWLRFHWHEARNRALKFQAEQIKDRNEQSSQPFSAFVLAIDEIQKIEQWSEVIKGLWDKDRANGLSMHVVLLGSAPLLMQKGLSETLAGRFETIIVSHWGLTEMQRAFDFSLEEYIYFGGYPGSAGLIRDEARWRRYVRDSLIQPNIEKDILQMVRIKNPVLLKQMFELGCHYSGQELSLTKMIAMLNEAKHTVTLAEYLDLLMQARLLTGLHKYAEQEVRKRNSVPKLHLFNTALMSAMQDYTFAEAQADRSHWGRLVESSVGAHLLNTCDGDIKLYYWREGSHEVDFVLARGHILCAIEVKSALQPLPSRGLGIFAQRYPNARKILRHPGRAAAAERGGGCRRAG